MNCKLKYVKFNESNEEKLKLLQRELEILLILHDSPKDERNNYVAKCYLRTLASNIGENRNTYFDNQLNSSITTQIKGIVLEYGGVNLKHFILQNHDILLSERILIIQKIAKGLKFLHDHKVVHGDLKPENIVSFILPNNPTIKWKIIDFDNSWIEGNSSYSLSNIQNLRVTPEYSSPELFQNNRSILNYKTDIWSLGVLSIFVLKGCSLWSLLHKREFEIEMLNHFDENLLNVILSNTREFGVKEKSFIEVCLKKIPELRNNCDTLEEKSLFTTDVPTETRNISNNLKQAKEDIIQNIDERTTALGAKLNNIQKKMK